VRAALAIGAAPCDKVTLIEATRRRRKAASAHHISVKEIGTLKDPFSVEGKVTIVTGGGTGIGESIAHEFARRGAPVLIASRKVENLERVRDAIRKEGGKCEMTQCDVRDAAQCDAMVAAAVSNFGRLDVLINNHGASIASPSLSLSPNGWRAVVQINLDGTFFCSKAAARQFMAQNSPGSIINISSTAGVHGSPMMLPYGAAKAGVVNLTASHASEWGAAGIRVNCIAPGPIDTEGAAPRVWPNPEVKQMVANSRALGRFGRVEEIAYPCIFLASDAAGYVTGALLIIDGGQSPRTMG
jgi:NAD(P)-dependent dehydrogenase (short-subunit alcohol dehydrogenase family)